MKKIALAIIGTIFISFGVLAIDFYIYFNAWSYTLWYCYLAMILMGIGAFMKKNILIESQLIIIFVPVTVWLTDFLYHLTTGQPLWGVTDYFFRELLPLARFITFEHFFIIPLGLIAWYLTPRRSSRAIIISIMEVAFIYLISRFSEPEHNVNCVFSSCFGPVPSNNWYPISWIAIMTLCIVIGWLLITFLSRHRTSPTMK